MTGFLDEDEALFLQTLKNNMDVPSSLQKADSGGLVSRLTGYTWIETRDVNESPMLTPLRAAVLASHQTDTGLSPCSQRETEAGSRSKSPIKTVSNNVIAPTRTESPENAMQKSSCHKLRKDPNEKAA